MFTKASLLPGPGGRVLHNLKRDSILREADASLRRLGIDAIDLYQIHLALVERLQTVADRHDTTPGVVAAAWALRHPAVDGAIIGFRRPEQVDAVIDAGRLELGDADVADIEDASRAGKTR